MGVYFSRWWKTEDYIEGIGFFDLPWEMRQMIVDLMDLRTKSRFSKCSDDCYEEVSRSRNFIEEIEIGDKGERKKREIHIVLRANGQKWMYRIMRIATGDCLVLWEMDKKIISYKLFENRETLMDVLLVYFNEILRKNAKSLKIFDIYTKT
ncbi:unnamed protein product [Caenorhabditis angaria]|uniref:F-box domain-containing protein n=1 Tax=Caenorhabditis angaria TaxID=860376 RepID=A0A9P1IW16_9PELO|nr:unnamed protein product [Caenorhabditis angaria]